MMIHFLSHKIAPSLDLKKIAAAYGLSAPESWEDCIVLEGQQLANIYMIHMPSKKVYLFAYGCIVFENFESDETTKFLKSIRLIIGDLDYKMLARYTESYATEIPELQGAQEDQKVQRAQEVPEIQQVHPLSYITAVVLAKSSALSKEEANISLLLDESESFINKLQAGTFNRGTRKSTKTMAHIIRFEYESAAAIKLFDRPSEVTGNLALREAYDELAKRFELEDRYEVLEKKVSELRNIVRSYSGLRNNRQEKRLLFFEIFLLTLFPLFRLAEFFLQKVGVKTVIKLLFTDLLQKFNIFF